MSLPYSLSDHNGNEYPNIDAALIHSIYRPRDEFAHKYDFGSALLYAGSKDMMGAAILCATAVLRSGAGLVTVYTTAATEAVMQIALPEAITTTEKDFSIIIQKKNVIGIGPGLEISDSYRTLLKQIIEQWEQGLVIDASALTMLAAYPDLLTKRKQYPAILTPHVGEFERLFGKAADHTDRIKMAMAKATELNCFIILKGHNTCVASPDGQGFFNTTGNAGMATAGSGDVLTGILTGLLAQGYSPLNACLLGVYIHGMAGDIAARKYSEEAMISGDIITCLGEAFKTIQLT
jgi:ADP-dependent NAD(P)H-hydrate dehydratase / NAD(P)H-hydrate epimerase